MQLSFSCKVLLLLLLAYFGLNERMWLRNRAKAKGLVEKNVKMKKKKRNELHTIEK